MVGVAGQGAGVGSGGGGGRARIGVRKCADGEPGARRVTLTLSSRVSRRKLSPSPTRSLCRRPGVEYTEGREGSTFTALVPVYAPRVPAPHVPERHTSWFRKSAPFSARSCNFAFLFSPSSLSVFRSLIPARCFLAGCAHTEPESARARLKTAHTPSERSRVVTCEELLCRIYEAASRGAA